MARLRSASQREMVWRAVVFCSVSLCVHLRKELVLMEFHDLFDEKDIKEAMKDPEVLKAKLELANEAVEYWQSIAPIEQDPRPDDRPPGTYRDSIHVVKHGNDVSVRTDDRIAHIIEYGGVHFPELACRARTEAHFNDRER